VSAYPVVLDGASIDAVIVGGGAVAARKARSLLAAGARVRIIAPHPSAEVRALASAEGQCTLIERSYAPGDLDRATFVVAATDQRDVNARVAADARQAGRLVNVADDPAAGNCVTVAVHRAGDLVIGVTAGGVPTVAARIRDAIAARFDDRYADAVRALGALRARLLAAGDREGWRRAREALITERFCAQVEAGVFTDEVATWR
jgi:siroheme synthase-like protein